MRRVAPLLLASAVIAAGCGNTQVVRRPASAGELDVINEAAGKDPPLVIEYQAGPGPGAPASLRAERILTADRQGTTFIELGGERRSIESARIRNVHTTNRGNGALRGLGYGALAGAVGGAVVGFADGDDWILSRNQKMVGGGIVFGVIGAAIGAVCGLVAGEQTAFVFRD